MTETAAEPTIRTNSVETVNVTPAGDQHLPYVWIIGSVTAIILIGFAAVTWAVLDAEKGSGIDAATKGAILQTWNNLAVMAAGFWVGSSLAGKMAPKPKEHG
jgi:hypothetical protein